MKYLTILGLAAVAAAALTAFAGAGTASATVLCSTTASPCPEGQKWPVNTVLDFSLESGTSLKWIDNNGNTIETCNGVTLKTKITNAGSSTSAVEVQNSTLDWSGCTWTNVTTVLGGLQIANITGTSDGTVKVNKEMGWTFVNPLFGTCTYGWAEGTQFGTLKEGKPATLEMKTTIIKLAGMALCPPNGTLAGSFTMTEPEGTTLSVEPS